MRDLQDETGKAWWESRTIVGSAIVIVSTLAGLAGWSVDSGVTTDIVLQVAAIIGGALAIYGRVKAERPIRRVRRAERVERTPMGPRGGLNKGFVNWSVLGAIAVIVASWALAIGLVVWICNVP
jgi:hypothetical protein